MTAAAIGTEFVIGSDGLQALMDSLERRGYRVVGPTLRDGAIVYDEITHIEDLPRGWTDSQEPGRYRVERRADAAMFGYAVGPQSWKRFLHPPVERIWEARNTGGELTFARDASQTNFAFLGVRSCELHAIAIQDKVFLGGSFRDSGYEERRQDNFFVAVNCGQAGGTCFCVSMQTGPKVERGFDLALTEILGERHEFVVEIGSDRGIAVFADVPHRPASPADSAAAASVIAKTTVGMGRTLETNGIKELLQGNPEHPRWDDVAQRCLSCANCTMVCPTCFCTTVEDHSDLAGEVSVRERKWDSCFTLDFSYIHGGSVRKETRSRYRQWITHKLAHWIDQFGTSGCVGCGRCITWCPVGIDITEEVAAIRGTCSNSRGSNGGP